MRQRLARLTTCLPVILAAACATGGDEPSMPAYGVGGEPQLFRGLGSHGRTVTTDSLEAQQYFDQGLTWGWSFNHDEAVRSFSRAAELDPGCAMAWWGVAWAQGPNYNDPHMTPARTAAAWAALQQALAALDDETPLERALVEALTHRYAEEEPADRTHLDARYSDAMAEVWARFGDEADVAVLYADALMVEHPWDLYTAARRVSRDDTDTIVATLERALELDPENPGANHLYIHAVEPSDDKDRGIAAADRLSTLVPASGHMRHMPSHIYVQVGQWDRAIAQNALAMESDDAYRSLAPEQGIQHGYMTHNSHMLAFAAMMVGREEEAVAAAREVWDDIPAEVLATFGPFFDTMMCSIYDVQKRFGRWDAILAEEAPPASLPATTAVWRAHRAIAFAARKDFAAAEAEHRAFRAAMEAMPESSGFDSHEAAMKFLTVSDLFVAGEIALQRGEWDEAARLLEQAVAVEDSLGYGEPPLWLQPARHTLGAVYFKKGDYAEAERVYREDLAKWRDNGWSLYGLSRALEARGEADEARATRERFDEVWAGADEPIRTSCKCIPEL